MENEVNLEHFGRYVRERRRELGLTQTALAERIGWTQERLSVIENGKYGLPTLPQLARLAGGLAVPCVELLGRLGITGMETPEEQVPHRTPARMVRLLDRIVTVTGEMQAVESRLHDAERQLVDAQSVCESLRSRRAQMAGLLAACRE